MTKKLATCLAALCAAMNLALAAGDLEAGFRTPPDEAKPRVYWWWLNNLVSKEGITRDLQEFKAKGIGGVLLFNAGGAAGPMLSGPDFMSPQWRELLKHAVREADRIGLEVSLNLCSGWDAGGPWISDDTASHHYVQAEMTMQGPQRFSGKLPQPPGSVTGYHDVAVQAFQLPAGTAKQRVQQPQASASSSQQDYPAAKAADGETDTMWVSNGWNDGDAPTPQRPEWLLLEYAEPIQTETLWITPRSPYGPRTIEVQTSEEGKTFTTIKSQTLKQDGEQTVPLPPTRSRIFRILVTGSYATQNTQISEVSLLPPAKRDSRRLLAFKSGRDSVSDMGSVRAGVESPLGPPPFDPDVPAIDPAAIVDLSGRLQPDGALTWDVPSGEWTIIRTGYTTTGQKVSCSTQGGEGPEMDWLDTRAMDLHFKSMAEVLLADSAPFVGKSLKYLHDDSWEVGLPNWTRDFLAEFRKYRGYDARTYLPVLAGHVVGSPEISDRFLYDLRKTIADCLAQNHYARFAELAHARGLGIHPEAGGPCWPKVVPMDALKNLGRCDIPMGEFWQSEHWHEGKNQNTNGKQTSTAAHIYGKRWVMAEAFTSIGPQWEEGPAELKPTADIALCEGINRFVQHTATSTRPEDGKPGYEYFAGTHFNPNITWWEQAGAWTAYTSRCQWLLSRGLFVADVCFYNGDWAPNLVEPKHLNAALGPGYDYDVCNAEVLLTRMSVKDGRIMLPDGMSYRLLALPNRPFMPVEVLQKVKELVEAGATVVGPRPERDPGLKNYPQCDDEVRKLAADLWGECDGKTVKQHKAGTGRIIWGESLREVLAESTVEPDFQYTAKDKGAFLDFIHRRDGGAEIYFVANRLNRDEAVQCTFRVRGRQPELWDPVSGAIREAAAFAQAGDHTTLPLEFAPYGSIFVIFQKPIPGDRQGTAASNSPRLFEPVELKGSWTVQFDPKWGGPVEPVQLEALADWTSRSEEGIKHYSGTATYLHEDFDLPVSISLNSHAAIYLDLGTVQNVAEVKLNGKELGVLWTRPFRVEITGMVKPRKNRLEIRITNLWPNRLIGDESLPAEKRFTRTNVKKFNEGTPLRPSGLLGPVSIQSAESTKER
ncbi:MAG: glycosyl hydrolase [Verrucomicrobia bacterium]|nr:glycosyl hydrolase [Verrucomicrobiota bacterium]